DQLWPGQPTTAGGPGSIDEFAAIDGLEGMDEAAPAAAVDSPPVTAPFVAPTPIPTPAPAWNASPSVTEIVPPATPRVEVPQPRTEVPPVRVVAQAPVSAGARSAKAEPPAPPPPPLAVVETPRPAPVSAGARSAKVEPAVVLPMARNPIRSEYAPPPFSDP